MRARVCVAVDKCHAVLRAVTLGPVPWRTKSTADCCCRARAPDAKLHLVHQSPPLSFSRSWALLMPKSAAPRCRWARGKLGRRLLEPENTQNKNHTHTHAQTQTQTQEPPAAKNAFSEGEHTRSAHRSCTAPKEELTPPHEGMQTLL